MLNDLLVGRSDTHVLPWMDSEKSIHRDIASALEGLVLAARENGIELKVCSGFRGFDAQLAIWNGKAKGLRPVLDESGAKIDLSQLPVDQAIERILRWSALPGLSRHHWGTDLDVYDAAAVPADYVIQLTPDEALTRFSKLHQWLDRNMARHGFFRPYAKDLGGVAPEAWHLSYAPISTELTQAHSVALARATIESAPEFAFREQVLRRLPELFERFFLRVSA